MRRFIGQTFRVLGNIWLMLALLSIAAGSLAVLIKGGLGEFLFLFNPFNLVNFVVMIAVIAPGFGLRFLAEKIYPKSTSKERR